ncbi:MAG: sugar nucleotide-binding protein [Candidatus Eisenbacteria bacterium]|uniref:dTDP-4-dehydrorhamnose reductase n=1 Tax=Eiseniibacteriota bacterium TaxID=2212470 RepID=A0A849SRD0_UNCEI|nr:sugar nucleotide-binding protein [Candidatus Eisenbacteria bacterium]
MTSAPHPILARPFVLGGSGLVGSSYVRAMHERGLPVRGTYRTRPAEGLEPFDFANDPAPLLDAARATLVILASALTNVDYCESHAEETWRRNVLELEPTVRWCREHDVPLVWFGTDYVFDGIAGPYAEDAPTHPLNVYGRSKLEGEARVATVPRHAILRVTNVFDIGLDRDRKNYLVRCVEYFRDRKPLVVPNDQLATPILAPWLAEFTLRLIEREALLAAGAPSVLNVACDELVSRVEFAARVAQRLGADASLVEGRRTSVLNQAAPRPLRAGFRNDRLKSLLGLTRISFDEALDQVTPRMREVFGAGTTS